MRGICIDLGTGNTSVSAMVKGDVFTEPSFVTVDINDNIIIDAGLVSKEAWGKTPENLTVVKPVSGGVIADYSAAEGMVKMLVKKACKRSVFTGITSVVTVPSNATQMERRAAEGTLKNLGMTTVHTIQSPMAAAVGAGVNVMTPTGSMVVDIGAGTCDAAVIAMGTIAAGTCIKQAGDAMDAAIVSYVKRKYNIAIGENTAEKIKAELAAAVPKPKSELRKYKGKDIAGGLPKEFMICSTEVADVIRDIIDKIIDAVVMTLEKTPPELLSNVMESGIILTGGCANIYGIDKLISAKTGFTATVAKNPLGCTIRGEEKILTDKKLRKLMGNN